MRRDVRSSSGFTLVEILAIFLVVVLAVGLLFARLNRAYVKPQRIKCVNNLKNVALAARIFARDNGDVLPGTLLRSNTTDLASIKIAPLFQMFSNELSTPLIVVCPSDRARRPANSFGSLTPKNISYFASLTADETMPQLFLAGDRNIQVDGKDADPGLLRLATDHTFGWSKEIHVRQGNIAMADGSVQQFSNARLNEESKSANSTNILVIP